MKTIQPKGATPAFEQRLKNYTQLSKAILLSPMDKPQSLLVLGAAFLAGIPSADAAIVYSGVQNISCALGGNTNRCYANIDNFGGNDFEIHRNHFIDSFGQPVMLVQVDEVNGGAIAINGFHAFGANGYAYPYANAAGVVIGPGGPWVFHAGQGNSLSDNGNYYYHQWEALPAGTTRFIGIRGTIGGNTHYGWIRLTKNGFGNYTIVDWAYDNTPNTAIITGVTQDVSFAAFDGRLDGDRTKLTWSTATEINNAGFHVERSEDGKNYRPIAWVDGHGTTTDFKEYSYDDKDIRPGKTYYYRLRQIDYDGTAHFSPIVTVTVFGDGPVVSEFYPNPSANGSVMLDFAAQHDGEWNVTVFDVAGKELNRQKVSVVEGVNMLQFDFGNIGDGLFIVKFDNGREKLYNKLVIE